jgi:hypothetical protein
MKPGSTRIVVKLCIVLGGYASAFLLACAALQVRIWLTWDEAAQSSAGMYAFADFLFFVGTLGILSLAPTALGLFFLCPGERSWSWFSIGALIVALVGPVAAVLAQPYQAYSLPLTLLWLGQILGAPLLLLAFVAFGILAPTRRARWSLFAAGLAEGLVCAYAGVCLLFLGHWVINP